MCINCVQNVMDDFVCALQKKILLQGRLYVFEHYVCFHANVFGYVKNIIIPLKVHGGSDHASFRISQVGIEFCVPQVL